MRSNKIYLNTNFIFAHLFCLRTFKFLAGENCFFFHFATTKKLIQNGLQEVDIKKAFFVQSNLYTLFYTKTAIL